MLLTLLLRYRRTYEQIAAVLDLTPAAVRRRAHRALGALAPEEAAALAPQRFAALCDLLCGQGSAADRLAAYAHLLQDPKANAFVRQAAEALAAQDRGLAQSWNLLLEDRAEPQPQVGRRQGMAALGGRQDAASDRPAAQSRRRHLPSLRRLQLSLPRPSLRRRPRISPALQGVVALVAAAGTLAGLLVGLEVFREPATKPLSGAATPTAATTSTTTTAAETVRQIATVRLEGVGGAGGEAEIASVNGHLDLALEAHGLPQTGSGTSYVLWLYNSPTSYLPLGRAPAVGANGVLPASTTELPADASAYHELILTKESSPEPTAPGEIVLHGALNLKGG